MAMPVEKIMALPTPWMHRVRISIAVVKLKAAKRDDAVKMTMPVAKTFFLP